MPLLVLTELGWKIGADMEAQSQVRGNTSVCMYSSLFGINSFVAATSCGEYWLLYKEEIAASWIAP